VTRKLASLALIGALLCGLDAPAVVLQGAAWASMLVRGLREGSVGAAVAETFDGQHPCAICERVSHAAPIASLSAAPQPKLDFIPPHVFPAPAAAVAFVSVPPLVAAPESRAAAPPVPPPDARA